MNDRKLAINEYSYKAGKLMADLLINEGIVMEPEYWEINPAYRDVNPIYSEFFKLESLNMMCQRIIMSVVRPSHRQSTFSIVDRANHMVWEWHFDSNEVTGNWKKVISNKKSFDQYIDMLDGKIEDET